MPFDLPTYQGLLQERNSGTMDPARAQAFDRLQAKGRFQPLDEQLDAQPATSLLQQNQPTVPPPAPGVATTSTATTRDPGTAFASRAGFDEIPGGRPGGLYEVLNRAVGAGQSTVADLANAPSAPGTAAWSAIKAAGTPYNLPGAAIGTALETSGHPQAADVAQFLTDIIPAVITGGRSLLRHMPGGVSRRISRLAAQAPEEANAAVRGGERLGEDLTRQYAQTTSQANVPLPLSNRARILEAAPEGRGPYGMTPGTRTLRQQSVVPGNPRGSITAADVPAGLQAARATQQAQGTALAKFQGLVNRAEAATDPIKQQVLLERAMAHIDQHFPGAQLPELDQLRRTSAELTRLREVLPNRRALVRTIGKTAGWATGIGYLGQQVAAGLAGRAGGGR
jgi:hypothetical protein